MHIPSRNLICCFPALSVLIAQSSSAISLPIRVDGSFGEWTSAAQVATDPIGDDGSSGIDFTTLYLANDEHRVFLRFDTTVEVQGDEGQAITLGLDTDENPNTGLSISGIGAELVWNLGARSGTFYGPGGSGPVDHASLGLLVAPTVSAVGFEIALLRDAQAGGDPVFPGPGFDLVIRDGTSGDVFVFDTPGYSFDEGPQPVVPIALERLNVSDVRIASYNVENDGLFSEGARRAALERIFGAIDPDIWVICEAWNHNGGEVGARVEQFLPSGPGQSWSSIKLDSGNVVVSRFPILDSWLVLPGTRLTAVLLDLRPLHDSELLVVANHWSCCTADQARQQQADALVGFLRDARTPGGVLDLAPGTPMVAAGDFNLVGWRGQLTTLVTGNIFDEGNYGPDSPPDWDGSDFDVVDARHPEARLVYTWRSDNSSFYPGKLDFILHTGSVTSLGASFVLETREMTAGTLGQYGLLSGDTGLASDHAPIVADLAPNSVPSDSGGSGEHEGDQRVQILSGNPNPFSTSVEIEYRLARPAVVQVDVFDTTGRQLRSLETAGSRAAGVHRVIWDGTTGRGSRVRAGRYLIRVEAAGRQSSRWVTLIR